MPGTAITNITVANPTVVTSAAHGLVSGQTVKIAGTNCTPSLNGDRVATVVDANTFTVPVNVTVSGNAGFAQRVFYIDYEAGNDSNNGTTFALRWKTISSGASGARTLPGDEIRIMASPAPTNMGQNATFTDGSGTVTLASAVNLDIDTCESAWSVVTNVTSSVIANNSFEGTNLTQVSIATAFTTGKAAFKATGTLNLSGYQQISFWIDSNVALTAGNLELRLCSDTLGVTSVNAFPIPAVPSGKWVPVTINFGSNLGSSIQSIALYVVTDFGAVSVLMDNIIACKASASVDSLSLRSSIGKNNGVDLTWWSIRSIRGTTVILNNGATVQTTPSAYSGISETVAVWKRETTAVTGTSTPQLNGATNNLIYFEGGWDRTAMTSQSDYTWLDARNVNAAVLSITRSFISMGRLALLSMSNILVSFGASCQAVILKDCFLTCTQANPILFSSICNPVTFLRCLIYSTYQSSNSLNGTGVLFDSCEFRANSSTVITLGGTANAQTFRSCIFSRNLAVVDSNSFGALPIFKGCTFLNNTNIFSLSSGSFLFRLKDCTTDAALLPSSQAGMNSRVISLNHNQTANDHRIFTDGGGVVTEASVRNTASGISWKMSVTSATRCAEYPLNFAVGSVAVAANSLVTVSLYMRRTNTGLTGMLVCKGGQIAGVASDVSAAMTAAQDTWQQVSITFTPTEAGVVEIEAWAYGGTTYSLYVDDLSVTQA